MKITSLPYFHNYYDSVKISDVEEQYDLVFSRPLGFIFAKILHHLGFNPNGISILGMFLGVVGGFLLFWQDNLWLTSSAFILVTIAGILDSSDGQAARLYNQKSKDGRILDAIMDNLVFIACYVFAVFHYIDEYTIVGCFLMGLLGGGAHSIKASVYEYYKGMYEYYTSFNKEARNPLPEDAETIYEKKPGFFRSLAFLFYTDYLRRQRLAVFRRDKNTKVFDDASVQNPNLFAQLYAHCNKPVLPFWAWTSGSNIMRNGILIFSLFGRFDLYCLVNFLSLIPYFLVGYYQNQQDEKLVQAARKELL